jgi:DNA helicase-2/ATP-dependent DNA helicase PcrA
MRTFAMGRHGDTPSGVALAHLNLEQQAVVRAPLGGNRLVLAGPGSGKTRTLVHRVAHLIDSGVSPEHLLLLTFTNRSAREMLDRVGELVPGDAGQVRGGTFHSVGARLLRRYAEAIGFTSDFTILDRGDAEDQVAAAVLDLAIDTTARRFPRASVLVKLFSAAVNRELDLHEVILRQAPQFRPMHDEIQAVAVRFVERKRAANQLDFDDLLVGWSLLADPPPGASPALRSASEEVCGLYREVLVDEYQDTNPVQGRIAAAMASVHGGLTVVGDDCQSIYAFRGADDHNILDFEARHSGVELFYLTENYRSTPEIIDLANASIAFNKRQYKKTLTPNRESNGFKPCVVPVRDRKMQSAFVAERVLDLRDEGVPLEEIAVLYRAHHHATELQVELTRQGVPYRVRSGLRFFEQAHIKDVLSFLRFLHNRGDELGWRRSVCCFSGIGPATARRAFSALGGGGDAALADLGGAAMRKVVGTRAAHNWQHVASLFAALIQRPSTAVSEMISEILESPFAEHIKFDYDNPQPRLDDIAQLADYAANFDDLEHFLSDLALLDTFQAKEVVTDEEPDEKLTLSTVHQSKGLEWRYVFVIGLSDGGFPMGTALREPDGEEEERRLFYVAITRAKDEVYMSFPEISGRQGNLRDVLPVSRFVREIELAQRARPRHERLLERVALVFGPQASIGSGAPEALPEP